MMDIIWILSALKEEGRLLARFRTSVDIGLLLDLCSFDSCPPSTNPSIDCLLWSFDALPPSPSFVVSDAAGLTDQVLPKHFKPNTSVYIKLKQETYQYHSEFPNGQSNLGNIIQVVFEESTASVLTVSGNPVCASKQARKRCKQKTSGGCLGESFARLVHFACRMTSLIREDVARTYFFTRANI